MTASANLAPGITFEDHWYAVQKIDERTFAIGEPLYHQQNWSYLLVGDTGTLLFDTGSFYGNLTGVVERRVRGLLTVLPSHMHFDHLGNVTKFDSVAIADLPMLRSCVQDGVLTPTEELFLGSFEGNTAPSFSVSRWIPVEEVIDLGGRSFQVLHTPGHSVDSVSLYSREENRLFAADFIYPGDLYGQVPGASLPEYLECTLQLCELLDDDTQIFCAHGDVAEDGEHAAPLLGLGDVEALQSGLQQIRCDAAGWSDQPEWRVEISSRLSLIISPEAVADWR